MARCMVLETKKHTYFIAVKTARYKFSGKIHSVKKLYEPFFVAFLLQTEEWEKPEFVTLSWNLNDSQHKQKKTSIYAG